MANFCCSALSVVVLTFFQITNGNEEKVMNTTNQAIDGDNADPLKNICSHHGGEYYREVGLHMVCCGNETLQQPDVLLHDQYANKAFADCTKLFTKDDASDFPTGMWKTFLCKLEKTKVFKSKDSITFEEVFKFMTQKYPDKVKAELKNFASKCKGTSEDSQNRPIESEKIDNHVKIQKFMECFYDAENSTCDKPYAEIENHFNDIKKTKELGCPVVPGLQWRSSIEYCCKKRSTPYPIMEFPGFVLPDSAWPAIYSCRDSFASKEMELKPEVFAVSTPKTDDGMDHTMHSSWTSLCLSACMVEQKNYTQAMLKLDFDKVIDFYTHEFGKSLKTSITDIVKRRHEKEKIYLSMDVDTEKSQPMTFKELSEKFNKADEKTKIQFMCKFVDTINMEERRAMHEYCFDEKYGNEWGSMHHSFFVPST